MFNPGDRVKIKDSINISGWDKKFVDWYNNLSPKSMEIISTKKRHCYIKTPGLKLFRDETCVIFNHRLELVSSPPKINYLEINKFIAGG